MSLIFAAQVAGAAASAYFQREANKDYDKIKEIQTEIADRQREFNLEQIQRAYAINYAQTMDQFVDARLDLSKQVEVNLSQGAETLTAISNVDMSGSSFNYEVLDAATDANFMQGLNQIAENQYYTMEALNQDKMSQQFGVETQYQNLISNISSTHAQSLQSGAAGNLAGVILQGVDDGKFDKFTEMFSSPPTGTTPTIS